MTLRVNQGGCLMERERVDFSKRVKDADDQRDTGRFGRKQPSCFSKVEIGKHFKEVVQEKSLMCASPSEGNCCF